MYQKLAARLADRGYNLSDYDNDPRKCGILAGVALCGLAREIREKQVEWEWDAQPETRRHRDGGKPPRGKASPPGPANANRTPLQVLEGGRESARARTLRRGRLEISILDQGDDIGVKPSLFARERGFDTFGASLLIAFDTEYEERPSDTDPTATRNEILSYQVLAVTPQRRWCEIVFHVRGGHRMSLSEIIDETRRILEIKPTALKGSEVRVVSHFGAAEWASLRDRNELSPLLQLIRKVPVTLGAKPVKLRMNNRPVMVRLSLVDTMLLAPDTKKSLAALGEVVGIQKIKLPDGAIERMGALRDEDRDLFEEYGINDTRITLAYYLKMADVALNELGLEAVPLTTGSLSVATFRASLSEREYLRMFGLKKVRGYRKTTVVPREYRELAEPLFTQGYAGGLNNATPADLGSEEGRVVLDIDFTSAYPTAASLLPVINWSGKGDNASEYEVVDAVGGGAALAISIALVDFEFPPHERRPCIPIRDSKYGLIYPRRGRGFATGPELHQAREKGARISIVRQEMLPYIASGKKGKARLAFAPHLGRMVDKRNRFPKKTLENEVYKLICNSFYGKLAQGLRERTITSFDSRVTLPESAVTCGPYAAMITGIVRAALVDLQDAIEEIGGVVHSATTDGCAASFAVPPGNVKSLDDIPGFWDAVLRKPGIQWMRQGLLNMGRPPEPFDLKAIGDSCEIWKTRGYAIRREGRVVHKGMGGHRLTPDELSEHARSDEIGTWTLKSLTGVQKVYTGKARDIVNIKSVRRVNLDYDYKLIPDGQGGYRPPETLEEFFEWREAAETIRRGDRRATEARVRMNLAGISQRGGEDVATRRMFLRAIAQDLCGMRPRDLKDREIAERLGFDPMDMKNARRRPYQPLPDLPEIRNIIGGMLTSLGMGERPIPDDLLSRNDPEP